MPQITKVSNTLFYKSVAVYSEDEVYRYSLVRTWDSSLPSLAFVMLNPSTATESSNDPTIERCERRAMAWGFGELQIYNLFALRSTDPKLLYTHSDPIGPDNHLAVTAAQIICAWGRHGKHLGRGEQVANLLPQPLYYLKLNSDGQPAHPLYLSYRLTPQLW